MTTYYDLLADQESIRMAQGGLEYAEKLLADNQAEAKSGLAAQYDVLRARRRSLCGSKHCWQRKTLSLKTANP